MKKLKILIPTPLTSNPYVFQLVQALQNHPEVEVVQYGIQWLKVDSFKFDIVHIQWPEFLIDSRTPCQKELQLLGNTIEKWIRNGTKIVATVHNKNPHDRNGALTCALYNLVYLNCDSFIHFGKSSELFLSKSHPQIRKTTKHYIVPHGNYEWFKNKISRYEARKILDIDQNRPMFLSIGSIRKYEELEMLKRIAGALREYNGILYFAGNIMVRSRRKLSYLTKVVPFIRTRNIIVSHGFIPDDDMQIYLNAADVLVIPRVNMLNSGNVALGFTFGKVVTGCDYGVIGDELKKLGNPVFDPDSKQSVRAAVEEALVKSKSDTGKRNQYYAENEMDWNRIAEQYVRIYKEALNRHKEQSGNMPHLITKMARIQ